MKTSLPRSLGPLVAALVASIQASPAGADSSRIRIAHPVQARAVQEAVEGARARLEAPGCRALLGEYRTPAGRPLDEGLAALDLTALEFLSLVVFADGGADGACRSPRVLAATRPGSRVVWVCGRFWTAQAADPDHAEVVILHETLHALGLAENPPTPEEINATVRERCRRRE